MTGRTILHYRIVEKIGAGGMGVVYKAIDTRLDRRVALKVLPPEAVTDESRKKRFIQEAKSASALNHPSIVTIYDIGEADGVNFIAMEFIDGRTLAATIDRKPMALGETLAIALQVTDALAKAHAAGIVHRDLKPANLMVTRDGLVKVLDFGLAKLTETAPLDEAPPTESIAQEASPPTEVGTILGTVAYMSPEQAQGLTVDARSDVFSFGSVLHEMLSGRRAFSGDSRVATMAAVLREEPAPIENVPHEVARVVARCLRKDPNRRFQTMVDLRLALADLREETESGQLAASTTASVPARAAWKPVLYTVAALALLALLVVRGVMVFRSRQAAEPVRLRFTQLTDQAGPETFPSLSPDGRSLAYASRASGNWDIYLQRVGGKNPVNLTKDSSAGDTQPAFSPDGEQIAFRSERNGGGIFVMGATGESVRRLTDFGNNPAWSPDGKEIVFSTARWADPASRIAREGQLWVVDSSSGEKRQLTRPDTVPDAVQPNWSPHGHRIAYWAVHGAQRDIWTVSADGTQPVAVTKDAALDWSPVWSPDGNYLYFASDRGGSMNLWRVRIDEKSGRVPGRLEAITTPSPYSGPISISRDGKRIAYVQQLTTANIQKAGFDPVKESIVSQPQWITQGSHQARDPQLSSDGEWLTFMEWGKQEDIFVIKTDGAGLRQLTNDVYKDRSPRWSPDGRRIAFSPRPRNLWVTGGLSAATERGSDGVCGRWRRRSVAPPPSRCERAGHR
ncbi:MAG: serine/threonine-protein kinase, partial [Acidobacteria bacterium]|nr:serine/threonine-protein kinase [Acidobacteriota bacterium]